MDQLCPQCEQRMHVKSASVVRQSGKSYNWSEFTCERDDIWIERWVPYAEEEASS